MRLRNRAQNANVVGGGGRNMLSFFLAPIAVRARVLSSREMKGSVSHPEHEQVDCCSA